MKLDNQLCTRKQAIRLKELGVYQQSYLYWTGNLIHTVEEWSVEGDEDTFYSAYTVAELGIMLPRYYPSWRFLEEGGQQELWITTVIGQPEGYERDKEDVIDIRTVAAFDRYGKTQAESMAALLISLLETKAISVEEINLRLKCE